MSLEAFNDRVLTFIRDLQQLKPDDSLWKFNYEAILKVVKIRLITNDKCILAEWRKIYSECKEFINECTNSNIAKVLKVLKNNKILSHLNLHEPKVAQSLKSEWRVIFATINEINGLLEQYLIEAGEIPADTKPTPVETDAVLPKETITEVNSKTVEKVLPNNPLVTQVSNTTTTTTTSIEHHLVEPSDVICGGEHDEIGHLPVNLEAAMSKFGLQNLYEILEKDQKEEDTLNDVVKFIDTNEHFKQANVQVNAHGIADILSIASKKLANKFENADLNVFDVMELLSEDPECKEALSKVVTQMKPKMDEEFVNAENDAVARLLYGKQ